MIQKLGCLAAWMFLLCLSMNALAIPNGEAYNVHPDDFPPRLKSALDSQSHWQTGYLDVTKAPYLAAGDGVTDDSVAIQNAMDDAYASNLVVFFPGNKTYLVSQQLRAVEASISRLQGFHLEGSTKGAKPVIKLKDNSSVQDNILILFSTVVDGQEVAPSAYNNTVRGIDIDMGNNPDVSAISMNGNQYNIIEDVAVTGADFFAGFHKIPGCGGGMVNVSVIGGKYGIYQDEYRPEPTVFGLYLEGQSINAIHIDESRGPVIIAGFKIVSPANPSDAYRAVHVQDHFGVLKNGVVDHGKANLVLYDGSIEITGNPNSIAIDNEASDLSLTNVFIKSPTLIQTGDTRYTSDVSVVAGNQSQWSHLTKYLFTSNLDKSSVIMAGASQNDRTSDYAYIEPVTTSAAAPATDFLHLHSWRSYLSWEDTNLVNIVTDFGATPEHIDDTDDDLPALQGAIDAVTDPANPHYGKTVFIPRGYFHISGTLVLKDGLSMIGAQRLSSMILPRHEWSNLEGPVVRTENSSVGGIYLADFGIVNNGHQRAAHFQAANMFIKDLGTERYGGLPGITNEPDSPLYLFSDNIGGNVYHLCLGSVPDKTPYGLPPKPNYHAVQFKNSRNPLTLYHLNVAHLPSSPQVDITNVHNLTIFGFKYEWEHELVHINNSENVKMYGGSGNYQLKLDADEAIIVVNNSHDIVVENFSRSEADPTEAVTEWIKDGSTYVTGDYSVLHFNIPVRDKSNDADGDGVADAADAFPQDAGEWADSDGDGVGDNSDALPHNPNEWLDTDKDGWGDNQDALPLSPYFHSNNNLLYNPGAELDQAGWRAGDTGGGSIAISTAEFKTGSKSFEVTNTLAGQLVSWRSDAVLIDPDAKVINLSGWVKRSSSAPMVAEVWSRAAFVDTGLSDTFPSVDTYFSGQGWQYFSVDFVQTDAIDYLKQVRLRLEHEGTVWFDDLAVNARPLNDADADGIDDALDPDDDNDGFLDGEDPDPLDPNVGVVTDPDADSDGVADGSDNCPDIANADQSDNDGDTQGDVCDSDDDNDGLPDETELSYGLDPLDAGDAALDLDGDGLSNLAEYQQGKDLANDDVAPELTMPADIVVTSTGPLTPVDLGTASAWDGKDKSLVPQVDNAGPFAPGRNLVTWSAQDQAGNRIIGQQRVDVIPLASFTASQTVSEGDNALLEVVLNGSAVTYPVRIPFTVAGSASYPADHSLAAGEVVIASGTEGSVAFSTVDDGMAEGNEVIDISMGNPTHAAIGASSTHRITLAEGNLPPAVTLAVSQAGAPMTTVLASGGNVLVSSSVSDPNPGDNHVYDWSRTSNALVPLAGYSAPQFSFDPSALLAGVYDLHLLVADDGVGLLTGTATDLVRVVTQVPTLSDGEDADNDGLSDADEGLQDTDGDRVPDYLDPIGAGNLLPTGVGDLIQTEPGYRLMLGNAAFAAGAAGAQLTEDDLLRVGGPLGTAGEADAEYDYLNGVTDVLVADVEPGGLVRLVVPLSVAILADAKFREYLPDTGWQDFVEDGTDLLMSTTGAPGACPAPGHASYSNGLSQGHYCLQLLIRDGGPNDADGEQNGRVALTGGVAQGFIPAPAVQASKSALSSSRFSKGEGERVVLGFVIDSDSSDLEIHQFSIGAGGALDEVNDIAKVALYFDRNGNGLPDAGEKLAESVYDADDGQINFNFSEAVMLSAGSSRFLVTYQF